MTFKLTTPEIDEKAAFVVALQERIYTGLEQEIEGAIHGGFAKLVRQLRDTKTDVLCELHAAEKELKVMELAHYQEGRALATQENKRLSEEAVKLQETAKIAEQQAEDVANQASAANHWIWRYEDHSYKATDELAALEAAETARLRNLARSA